MADVNGEPVAGVPFPELFPQDRRFDPSEADREAVGLQKRFLGSRVRDADWQRDQLEELRRRRLTVTDIDPAAPEDPFRLRFSVIEVENRVVVSADRVLVRTADYLGEQDGDPSPMQRILADFDDFVPRLADSPEIDVRFDHPAEPGELEGRLVTLMPSKLRNGELLAPVRNLREAGGFPATLDHIVPLNVVLKSKSPVRRTDRSVPFPPPWTQKGSPVVVAVIDTGVNTTHRVDGWLDNTEDAGNTDPLDRFPLVPGPDGILDFAAGHGTFVSGCIEQVSPSTTVRVYRAIDSDGIGSEVTVAIAIVRAAREGADIINLSLGTDTLDDHSPLALRTAFEILAEKYPDVLVVAAAGNSGSAEPTWPSAFRGVVSVAALTADLKPAEWSNHGPLVTLWTVGEGVLSTYVPGTTPSDPETGPGQTFDDDHLWGLGSGTSFAAPQVAGAIARLLQNPDRANLDPPVYNAQDAVAYLIAHSFPVTDQYTTNGNTTTITTPGVRLLPGTPTP